MNDDNVRHLWSDAELDEALDALNPHVRTDPAELDRARATLLRAASAEAGHLPAAPSKSKRTKGTWRWIAVAAAVALVTGGVAVGREVLTPDTTVAPAATATADVVPGPGQYTHVTNTYIDVEWVGGLKSAFSVRQTVEYWIPADRSGVWKRKWTRPIDAAILTGQPDDQASLPGPNTVTQVAAGGDFRQPFPYASGGTADIPEGWDRPTPHFVASLPADPSTLLNLARSETGSKPNSANSPLVPFSVYPDPTLPGGFDLSHAPFTAPYVGPGETETHLLTLLASGLASRSVRAAAIGALATSAHSTIKGDTAVYTFDYGIHKLIVNVNLATSELVSAANVATQNTYGIRAGTSLSSAELSFEVTTDFGS
ncbi:hypothetical protein ACWEOE_18755 [Amycolatopsis sp. NPDC004368]